MNEQEFQSLKNKIDRGLPLRLKLAELAGMPKLNPKNYAAMMEFDLTIKELFFEVAVRKPENLMAALVLVKGD